MTRALLLIVTLGLVLAAGGCGGDDPDDPPTTADPFATPKGSLEAQLELLKAGEVEKLRACFTERQRDRITAEAVEGARAEAAAMTMDQLFASMEPGMYEGKKTAKVKMANGRTLTTLVLVDGKWLSDTVWFK